MGFGVWGLGFGVWGLGFGVWGLGFGVRVLERRLQDSLRCLEQLRGVHLGRASGVKLKVSGFGFWVWGLGFRFFFFLGGGGGGYTLRCLWAIMAIFWGDLEANIS